MTAIEFQDRFAEEMVKLAPKGWKGAEVRYEYYLSEGSPFEMYKINYSGVPKGLFKLSFDAKDLLRDLHNMCDPGGKWTWFVFSMKSSGKYSFDYKYDRPPMVGNILDSVSK